MAISTSIVVSFGGGAGDSSLVAELDDTRNNNKYSFLSTETAFFAIYKYPSTYLVNQPVPTAGMVSPAGSVTRAKTQTLQFVGTQEVELDYPPDGAVTLVRWYGTAGQGFTISGLTATITSTAPCICDISYSTTGELWELIPPTIDLSATPNYPIVIYVTGDDV